MQKRGTKVAPRCPLLSWWFLIFTGFFSQLLNTKLIFLGSYLITLKFESWMIMVSSESIIQYAKMGLFFPGHFSLHLLPFKFIHHSILLSLHCLVIQLAHSTDTLNNSVFSANLVALFFTLFLVTLVYPTFILWFHDCLVSLKAFGQELCQMSFGNCRLCQLDHVYTHACRPSPLKNPRDFWEVGCPLQKQSWILTRISYLYIHSNTPLLLHFLVICWVDTSGWQAWLPSSLWDPF